ncbi:MAG: glycerophosphodiester phosphodiesterase [Cyanothece sp. SIO2G6]|nr:glycerophosphodiester phosphodiesterase [Cyanothece sp. SIO2G6]
MDWMLERAIAHRGLHSGSTVPENSMGAFAAAMAHNHPIELDVQLLADGQVVVFHDTRLERMTGQTGAIAHQTLATLKPLRLMGTNQHIPCLSEVLTLINGQVPVLIEIKNEGKAGALEAALLEILSDYRGEFAIQSFNPYSLIWFKKHAPHIVRGQLSSNFKGANLTWLLKIILGNMLLNWASVPHFIAYDVNALPNLATTVANRIFKRPLLAWTVRSQADHQRALEYADNIIFDPF